MIAVTLTLCNHRDAPDVQTQPWVAIRSWYIGESEGAERTLVGLLQNGITWRATTSIARFMAAERTIFTASGRCYELQGPPANDADSFLIIAAKLAMSGIGPCDNVSGLYWRAIRDSTQ